MMHSTKLKVAVQTTGTAIALTALYLFVRAFVLFAMRDWLAFSFVFAIGCYFVFVGYATWHKFSLGAISHITAATLFWLFFLARIPISMLSLDRRIEGMLLFLLLMVSFYTHRKISRRLTTLIF